MSLRTEISCIPLGNEGFINVLNANYVPSPSTEKKNTKKQNETNSHRRGASKIVHQLSITDVKMLLLTRKIG